MIFKTVSETEIKTLPGFNFVVKVSYQLGMETKHVYVEYEVFPYETDPPHEALFARLCASTDIELIKNTIKEVKEWKKQS